MSPTNNNNNNNNKKIKVINDNNINNNTKKDFPFTTQLLMLFLVRICDSKGLGALFVKSILPFLNIYDYYCCEKTLSGPYRHKDIVNSVSCFRDPSNGKMKFVSGSCDETIKVWDYYTGDCEKTLSGHLGKVNTISCFRDPSNGKMKIVSGSDDSEIKVWDYVSGQCEKSLSDANIVNFVLCFHDPSNTKIKFVSCNGDPIFKVWDFETGDCEKTLSGPNSPGRHKSYIKSVSVFQDTNTGKNKFISGSIDHTIKVWDYISGQCEKTLSAFNTPNRHTHFVNSVSSFQDPINGKMKFVSCGYDYTIKVWDYVSGQCEKTLFHSNIVNSVSCFRDPSNGKMKFVSGSCDETIKVWDYYTGDCEKTLLGHAREVYSVLVFQDTKYRKNKIVSGSGNGTIKIWS
jgi:WD40 repeat protein